MSAGLVCGGALLMLGAALPWLTLYAGFQQYSGLVGQFGWGIFATGLLAIVAGMFALRGRRLWLERTSPALGIAVMAFAVWLLQGLHEITHRPDAVMLVPRDGPGLYVIAAGAIAIVLGPAVQHSFGVRRR